MTNVESIEAKLWFLIEIDKLKSIVRASPLIDQSRKENSAEHSWHLAMYALVLHQYANTDVDLFRVVKMLLLHDLVEIDAGDFPVHASVDLEKQRELERKAADRIYSLVPGEGFAHLRALWEEFEESKTCDARFAKALDRLQPLLTNICTNGGTWRERKVTYDQVVQRYGSVISGGSKELWAHVHELVKQHFHIDN